MIQQENSYNLMERFAKTESDIKSIRNSMYTIQEDMEKKLTTINAVQQYNTYLLRQIQEKKRNQDDKSNCIVFAYEDDIVAGNYGIYGQTIHPSFIGTPRNLFNFYTSQGYVYRDIATVTINDDTRDEYKDILKHDSILGQSPVFFQETDDYVTMEIKFADNVVSDRTANVIELCPFLPGSFSIEELTIQPQSGAAVQYTDLEKQIQNIDEVGRMRIILDEKVSLKTVTFKIRLYYTHNGTYPFGFQHIYFYNANISDTSYAIVRIQKPSYIDYISEKIYLHDQYQTLETSCSEQNIQAYMYYKDGILTGEIGTTDNSERNYLTKNVNTIYVKIPIKTGLISMTYKTIGLR